MNNEKLISELGDASRAFRKTVPDEYFAEKTYRKAIESKQDLPFAAMKSPAFAVLVPVLCILVAVFFITENYMVQEKAVYLMELLVTGVSGVVI
jgi:hypothetical protein